MIVRRVSVSLVLLSFAVPLVLAARSGQKPAGDLGFGKWTFTGKDKAGVVWTGTLVIEKADSSMFDAKQVIAQGNLQLRAADDSGKGFLSPIYYDPAARGFTLGGDSDYGGAVFTAVLSADGKSLTKGVWRETEWVSEEKKKRLVSEGEWSAVRVD